MTLRYIFTLLLCIYSGTAYKILVVSPMPGRSHSILGDGVVNLLSDAGHEITYITAFPHKKPPSNVKEIDVSSNKEIMPESILNFTSLLNKEVDFSNVANFIHIMFDLSAATLENPDVQKVLKDPNQRFDVIVAEWMYSDIYVGLPAILQCPFIWLSTVEPHWKVLNLIDEVPNPAYNSDAISGNLPPFSFKQRVQELAIQISGLALEYFYTIGLEKSNYEKILVPIIRERGFAVPTFEELRYNASLVLGNSHVSMGKATRLPPSYKAIGGYHIQREVKPLPADLKKLLDDAKYGVIFFSMGSNLKSKLMPDELKQDLLKMFGTLKQTVLWKFEDNLPNRPDNVHIVQWAPQQSILAHPNCVLFMTHGGLLSTTEAIFFAKPIVAIPVFADQFSNANHAVVKGFAEKVDLSYTMADDIKIAIEKVLGNPTYTMKARELSLIHHDRPVPPGKELVHWVEHVVKTRGAPHLRSPALDTPLYQKLYLDLVVLILAILYAIKFAAKRLYAKIRSKKSQNLDKKKRK